MVKRLDEKDLETRSRFEGGFTLIELLVVVIILGILAAVVVFSVGGVGDSGQANACKIDTKILKTAEAAYFANQREVSDNGRGSYTNQAGLTAGDEPFLSDPSTLHDVRGDNADGSAALPWVRVTPTVTAEGAKKCLPKEAKPSSVQECPDGAPTDGTWPVGSCTVTPNGTPIPYPF